MYRIWEIDPSLPLGPNNLMPMVHPDDAAMVQGRVDRMRQGLDNPENEERILMPDGRIKWMSNSTLVFHHEDGRVECVGVSQDITKRRLAEQASEKLRSELAHVTRVLSLGELAASIAHEVNQPLSGIITNANTCLRMLATDPPNIEGAIRTAERSVRDGNRAAEVIKRLRSLYRKQDFALELLDLNDAAREVIAICAHDLQRRRIAMTVDLDNELPHVTGDRIQLQQVILNLVLNAADALSAVDDRPRQISILSVQHQTGRVQLMVRDTGTGIAKEDRERIFEPFHTTKPHGMGIGLSVSRSIIDRHKGKLWAMSNEGPGTTLVFSLPVASKDGA
ncbi:signal transduction histidine kinase [Sphingopyxis sp. OAS728]|nr:signal transduction histidine kinase [Sphingopyxis sp. OAS728]